MSELVKVEDPGDPKRCQSVTKYGQCVYYAVDGTPFCPKHGSDQATLDQGQTQLYRLHKARYRRRMEELKDHDQVKSLRDEIALCRLLIEERFNKIRNDADLLAAYSVVNSLVLTLERLIKTTHQLELNLGTLLAKPTVVNIGNAIIQIVGEELKQVEGYEQIVDRVCDRVLTTIGEATNEET